jgi:hypothetical protein
MENKQTAVEWLVEQLKEYDFTPASNNEEYVIIMPQWIFNAKRYEAKAMEKEQMIEAYKYGNLSDVYFKPEQYYNETYGKGNS